MAPLRSSIGVELEILIGCTREAVVGPVPPCFADSKGGPLMLPEPVDQDPTEQMKLLVEASVLDTIRRALNEHGQRGGDYVIDESRSDSSLGPDEYHLRRYREWRVVEDSTVWLTIDEQDEEEEEEEVVDMRHVRSPAFWATDASFEEIGVVVQALADTYWILTPPTAGLHFHYGSGKEYVPFPAVRRIAALLYAADPVLAQLHPAHRRENNYYCRSNRQYSRLAHGYTAALMARELEARDVEADAEVPGSLSKTTRPETPRPQYPRQPRPSHHESPHSRGPSLKVMYKRGELTGYPALNREQFLSTIAHEHRPLYEGVEPLDIPSAVREILSCPNAPTAAALMTETGMLRPAYSFKAYAASLYRRPHMLGTQLSPYQSKRTIEFRQQASTIVAEEVVAHGRVVVGLCEFATSAHLADIWKIVLDCAMGETHGDWYDVFDLLAETGLSKEAKVLQRSIARWRGDRIPEEFDRDDDGESHL
ncbi:putative amidoligase enzyme-domain-containing protein [Xylariaceae sp. FL0594]|nr:putative amidoligase enzyme-domain-containing protein [Xylariaceae sp. FL0594]